MLLLKFDERGQKKSARIDRSLVIFLVCCNKSR